MTNDPLRSAAQALLDKLDEFTVRRRHIHPWQDESESLRSALASPSPMEAGAGCGITRCGDTSDCRHVRQIEDAERELVMARTRIAVLAQRGVGGRGPTDDEIRLLNEQEWSHRQQYKDRVTELEAEVARLEGWRAGMEEAASIAECDLIGPEDGSSTCCVESFNLGLTRTAISIRERIAAREKEAGQ